MAMGIETRYSNEGIEARVEPKPGRREFSMEMDLVGHVRADVDLSFGEPGTEVFRYPVCLGCLGNGRYYLSFCYVEG